MNKALLATAACAALGLASAAQATVVTTVTIQTPSLTGMTTPAPGWVGYKVSLVSDQGVISAIDFGGVDATKPNEALKGLFGRFSQRTALSAGDPDNGIPPSSTPTPAGAVSAQNTATSRDSLWNNAWAQTGEIYPRNEDNDGVNGAAGNPLADSSTSDWGVGHAMHFATGVAAAAQASTLDIAYIVGQPGQVLTVTGEVQAGTGGKTSIQQAITLPPVPEPTTASLMGLSLLGLAARRRRS